MIKRLRTRLPLEDAIRHPKIVSALEYALTTYCPSYKEVKAFAQGGGGILFLVYKDEQTKMLLKIPAYEKRPPEEHHIAEHDLVKEAEILRDFHCDLIPQLIASNPSGKYIYRQFVEGQPLPNFVESIDDSEKSKIMRNVFVTGKQLLARFHKNPKGCHVIRDFKPVNLIVENGTQHIKLVDVGSVRPEANVLPRTPRPEILGSGKWLYWPPEQLLGKRECIDRRLDFFSFGSTVFFIVTGRAPYDNLEPNPDRVIERYMSQYVSVIQVIRSSSIILKAPSRFVEFLIHCLHPLPEERPWEIDDSVLW
jgi:serine/threonine protein kinase